MRERVWLEAEARTIYVAAENASLGGIFVRTTQRLQPGTSVKIAFAEIEGAPVEVIAVAEVAWRREDQPSRPAGLGLKIVSIERGAHELEGFLERLAAREVV